MVNSPTNILFFYLEPNLKLRMQVQLKNFAGVDEAGIDGGGLFREFIWELLKTAFDPNRGLFQSTTDKLLYPNPFAKKLFQDQEQDYRAHYFFLGRILGKVGSSFSSFYSHGRRVADPSVCLSVRLSVCPSTFQVGFCSATELQNYWAESNDTFYYERIYIEVVHLGIGFVV